MILTEQEQSEKSDEITFREKAGMDPIGCEQELCERTCMSCDYKTHENVSHPGGDSSHTVKKYSCERGYWEDDF